MQPLDMRLLYAIGVFPVRASTDESGGAIIKDKYLVA